MPVRRVRRCLTIAINSDRGTADMRQAVRFKSILLATGLLISGYSGAAPNENQAAESADGAGDVGDVYTDI